MIFFLPAMLAALLFATGLGLIIPPLDFLAGGRLLLLHGTFVFAAITFRFGGALLFALLAGVLWDFSTMPVFDSPLAENAMRPGWSIIFFGCAAAVLNGIRGVVLSGRRWDLHAVASGMIVFFHFSTELIYITLARYESAPPEFSLDSLAKIGATALLSLLTAPLIYFSLTGIETLCGSPVRRGGPAR